MCAAAYAKTHTSNLINYKISKFALEKLTEEVLDVFSWDKKKFLNSLKRLTWHKVSLFCLIKWISWSRMGGEHKWFDFEWGKISSGLHPTHVNVFIQVSKTASDAKFPAIILNHLQSKHTHTYIREAVRKIKFAIYCWNVNDIQH